MTEVYVASILISILCAAIPWTLVALEEEGIVIDFLYNGIFIFMIVFPIIGLILSYVYIKKHIHSMKYRILMILFNPVLYYLIFILWIICDLFINGLHPGNF